MIKERDILKLLTGEASPKKLKKLQKWSAKDPKHVKDLEQYQRIFDEADHLVQYQKVDSDAEFALFQDMISAGQEVPKEETQPPTPIDDHQLLRYFDGLATPKERQVVDLWLEESSGNPGELEILNRILSESKSIKSYKQVDIDSEWAEFNKVMQSNSQTNNEVKFRTPSYTEIHTEAPIATPQSTTKTVTLDPVIPSIAVASTGAASTEAKEVTFAPRPHEEERRSWMRPMAIAASLLLLCTLGYINRDQLFGSNQGLYDTYATAEDPHFIRLSDGSTMNLNDNTEAKYYRDYSKVNYRDITLDGKAEFEVVSMPEKPFVVKTPKTGVGVTVLGTKFKFESHDYYQEVIANIEGSVRAYSLEDTTISVVLEQGDRVGFDGYGFTDLNEVPYEGKDYKILYVLDYLMQESDWRVTSAPYSKFDLDGMVNVNLDQDYSMILSDLVDRADFEFVARTCDGCYHITRFAVKEFSK